MTVNPIETQARAAARNSNGRRPSARSRIEAAAAANAAAAEASAAANAAAEAVAHAMGELYANPLIARLDAEGLGSELTGDDLQAILHLVRSLEARAPLPQRHAGTGEQPAQRL